MPRSLLQSDKKVDAIRAFNRFYAESMGFMNERLSEDFCLTELRVLSEISRAKSTTAKVIAQRSGIDAGYLSRILKRLERKDIIERRALASDARVRGLSLSSEGKRVYQGISRKIEKNISNLLAQLTADEQRRLLGAMDEIQRLLKTPK